MSSILTNTSAMVALQTMKSISTNLNKVQSEISTGKSVAVARDNAAVWAISKVMESDAKAFKGISDSLSLGSSTLTVAREAAEKISDLLTEMKGKIVSAQGENVPRDKLQTDIAALRGQIDGIVSAAQFSGLNLISGTESVNFLSSLDRSNSGVSTSDITVARHDLGAGGGTYGPSTATDLSSNITAGAGTISNAANTATVTIGGTLAAGLTASLTIAGKVVTFTAEASDTATTAGSKIAAAINALGLEGVSAAAATGVITISSTRAFEAVGITASGSGTLTATPATASIVERAELVNFANVAVNDGDGYRVTIGGAQYNYIAGEGETMKDVAQGLKIAIDSAKVGGLSTKVVQNADSSWSLKVDYAGNGTVTSLTLADEGRAGGKASGGLFGLDALDVTTTAGARAALENIETMINRAIDSAAAFGSAQGRIDIQSSFVSALTDAITAGIGNLVDADMEEASARLQALQVQQQLGIQALAIANQQPQNLLSLFR